MSYAIRPLQHTLEDQAAEYLRKELHPQTLAEVRAGKHKANPWFHFSGGMAIRNLLRQGGFTDDQLPDNSGCGGNWDDYYVQVLEEAARRGKPKPRPSLWKRVFG